MKGRHVYWKRRDRGDDSSSSEDSDGGSCTPSLEPHYDCESNETHFAKAEEDTCSPSETESLEQGELHPRHDAPSSPLRGRQSPVRPLPEAPPEPPLDRADSPRARGVASPSPSPSPENSPVCRESPPAPEERPEEGSSPEAQEPLTARDMSPSRREPPEKLEAPNEREFELPAGRGRVLEVLLFPKSPKELLPAPAAAPTATTREASPLCNARAWSSDREWSRKKKKKWGSKKKRQARFAPPQPTQSVSPWLPSQQPFAQEPILPPALHPLQPPYTVWLSQPLQPLEPPVSTGSVFGRRDEFLQSVRASMEEMCSQLVVARQLGDTNGARQLQQKTCSLWKLLEEQEGNLSYLKRNFREMLLKMDIDPSVETIVKGEPIILRDDWNDNGKFPQNQHWGAGGGSYEYYDDAEPGPAPSLSPRAHVYRSYSHRR